MDNISSDNQDEIKKLARKGRELGYILISELNKTIKGLALADQKYIKDTMEKLKIQIVNSPEEYDEYKYLSGKEAINILQSLSDGKSQAFVEEQKEKDKSET